jgi:phytoene dehydrogenase-like protein
VSHSGANTVDRFDTVVVGGGLAGLASAALVARSGANVAVLDTRSPGGRARSDDRLGYRLNQGPHALYWGGPARQVLAELGVVPSGGKPPLSGAMARRGGELLPFPTTPIQLFRRRLLGARSTAQAGRVLLGLGRVQPQSLAGISAAAWLESYGLSPDALEVVTTLVRVATYCDDLGLLAADAASRQAQLALRGGVRYIDGGWQSLVDGLLRAAGDAGVAVVPDGAASSIEPERNGWTVASGSRRLVTRTVIVATGSPEAARRLLPVDPGWSGEPEATVACLDLGLRRPPRHPIVFGLDEPLYLSTHCPPANLAPPPGAVVHVMRYGARTSDLDRAELESLAEQAGIGEDDIVTKRFLHRMVVSHALPAPGAGLAGRPPVAVPELPGVFVAGDWVGPIGLLADASLSSARAASRSVTSYLERSPALV